VTGDTTTTIIGRCTTEETGAFSRAFWEHLLLTGLLVPFAAEAGLVPFTLHHATMRNREIRGRSSGQRPFLPCLPPIRGR
jgi:hypothetical protein